VRSTWTFVFGIAGSGAICRVLLLSSCGLCLCLSACGGGGGSSTSGPGAQPTLSSIVLSPSPLTLVAGQNQQLTATANYSDGSTKDVTATAGWSSSSTSVATVSTGGLVTSVAAGTASISATLSGLSGSDAVTVNAKALVGISVSPPTTSFPIGTTQQYSAVGKYNDGTTSDLTSAVNWSSSSPAIATVSQGGLATGVSSGATDISASTSGITGNAQLAVNMPIPSSWNAMGVDYGLKKQCIRTPSPGQTNFYYDNVDCPGPSYPTSGYWTTAVETEMSTGALCGGATDQSFLINGTGSPVSETWTGNSSSGYAVELGTDYSSIANPCTAPTFAWVPLMDNWVGGGPLPAPNHLVVQFNATFTRNLPTGSGATRAFAGVGAQWNIAGAGGNPTPATFSVEVNFYIDEPQWGSQANLPADVIALQTNIGGFSYYAALDGSKLFGPISAPLSAETQITVNWAAVFQHVIDEGLFPPPVNGWSGSSAATSAAFAGTEVMNFTHGAGGPTANLIVSKYQEGAF
jgi:hypothetical protein